MTAVTETLKSLLRNAIQDQSSADKLADIVGPSAEKFLIADKNISLSAASEIIKSLPTELLPLSSNLIASLDLLNTANMPASNVAPAQETDPVLDSIKAKLKEAWALYEKGEHPKVLDVTEELLEQYGDKIPFNERRELHAARSWGHYRRGEYERSLDEIQLSNEHTRALECELYIRSFVDGYKDEAKVSELNQKIGVNIVSANAFVVRARDKRNENVPYDRVMELVAEYSHMGDQDPVDVNYANLLHNASRVFLDRARDNKDLLEAATLIAASLVCYGVGDRNLHHRAAAHFWQSNIYEKLGDPGSALAAATNSLKCWEMQVGLDTRNPGHLPKYKNAYQHLIQMSERVGISLAKLLEEAA